MLEQYLKSQYEQYRTAQGLYGKLELIADEATDEASSQSEDK